MSDKLYIPRNDLAIYRSYNVEVPLNSIAQGGQNKFLLNEFLQTALTGSMIFVGCETFIDTTQAKSESGRTIINATEAAALGVTFIWGQKELLYLQPYTSFLAINNYGMIRRLDNLQITLTDSYCKNFDAVAANKSAAFTFYFLPTELSESMKRGKMV